jgi:hypothetical protein
MSAIAFWKLLRFENARGPENTTRAVSPSKQSTRRNAKDSAWALLRCTACPPPPTRTQERSATGLSPRRSVSASTPRALVSRTVERTSGTVHRPVGSQTISRSRGSQRSRKERSLCRPSTPGVIELGVAKMSAPPPSSRKARTEASSAAPQTLVSWRCPQAPDSASTCNVLVPRPGSASPCRCVR